MFCPNCGEEVFLEEAFNRVKYGICESCNHEFTIRDYGQASANKMDKARKKFQKKYESSVKGFESLNKTLARIRTNY
ncbi:MAG: hypothetical protein ACOCZT_01220 [Halanaerobiales bacterium]